MTSWLFSELSLSLCHRFLHRNITGSRMAGMASVLRIVVFFCLGVTGVYSMCPNVILWEGVPEESYDRNYSSIDDENARPLGFARDEIYYSDIGKPNPCIKVMGIDDTRVEVMAESNPPGSKFCVKDQYNREICDARIYDCRQANRPEDGEDSITFEFYCDSNSCDETDVNIFYRFTVSSPGDVQDPEIFCDFRDTGEYPSSLNAPLPTNRNLATLPPDDMSSAPYGARPLGLAALCSVLRLVSWALHV